MPLITGAVISFTDGTTGIVDSKLGEGGQGEVYLIKHQGVSRALKWYKERPSLAFVDNLKRNVERSSPASSFLWPIAVSDSEQGVGYVMNLTKRGSNDFSKFLANMYHFKDEEAIISAAINLCIAFQKLHLQGLAYFDLNDGNFFFNPDTGEIQIGDNDNVSSANFNVSNIGGKRGYMAPEVVLGGNPNRYSDYFSLAIILFRLIFVDHPLHGKNMEKFACMTPKVITYLYGTNPIFIFDPNNHENEASDEFSPNALSRWNEVPGFVRKAFIRAFSRNSQLDPTGRMMESVWIKVFQRWRSYLNVCPNCGNATYVEPECGGRCKECGYTTSIFWMQSDYKEYIPLVLGQKIYETQIGLEGHFTVVAEVVGAKNGGNVLGMRNLSSFDWSVTYESRLKIIKSGEAFRLEDNMIIKFSNIKEMKIKLVNPK